MSELRDYQVKAIDMVRQRAHDRPLLVMATGSGKTVVAAEIIRRATERGKRTVFLVHRRELVDQAVKRLAHVGIRAGKIIAGETPDHALPVQVCSIPTLVRRNHVPADLVFIDECSFAMARTWRECIERYKGAMVIGLTATPIRLDGRGLGELFGCIVEPVTMRELVERGHIIEPRVFAPPIDLRGVHIQHGDYRLPEIAERMNKLTGSITRTWIERAHGLKTIACAVNCEHSQAIADAFVALGVRAAHLDYKVPKKQRQRILNDWFSDRLDIVSQVDLFSYGFDFPELHCAILARPTKSLALFRQQVGRIVRPPAPALVLDHAGNTLDHGRISDPIEWSLDTPKKRAASTAPVVRTCTECFCVLSPEDDVCPECGAACTRVSSATPPKVDNPGELVELDMSARTAPMKNVPLSERESAYRRLVQSASYKQRKLGAARAMYKERFGEWPRFGQIELECYTCTEHQWEQKPFGTRCARCLRSPAAVAVTR